MMGCFYKADLVSIDAWAVPCFDGDDEECTMWEWNNSFRLEEGIFFGDEVKGEEYIDWAISAGYLTKEAKDLVIVDESQWLIVEFQIKKDNEPILALMFSDKQYPIKEDDNE